MTALGRVVSVFRHPVKSMGGEALDEIVLEADGISGDRVWGVRDRLAGTILSAKRVGALLDACARCDPDSGGVLVTLPDGTAYQAGDPELDAALGAWLGLDVALERATAGQAATYECPERLEDDTSELLTFSGPAGRFVDGWPAHILTTASLAAGASTHPAGDWDIRRFRPNLLVEVDSGGFVEDGWVGHRLRIGDAELEVAKRTNRCVMVTRAQAGLPRDLDVARTLARQHGADLGVNARVTTPGAVRVGDTVELV